MKSIEEHDKLCAALVQAQKAAPTVLGKVDRNAFAQFDYVSADRLIMAGRAAMASAGLALVPVSHDLTEGRGGSFATLRTVYRLVHESGQSLELTYEVPAVTGKGKPEDKATFGAMTESLGYAYRGLLAIGRLDQSEVSIAGRDDTDYTPPPPRRPTPPEVKRGADQVLGAILGTPEQDPSAVYAEGIKTTVRKAKTGDLSWEAARVELNQIKSVAKSAMGKPPEALIELWNRASDVVDEAIERAAIKSEDAAK
jgi:hypothetical protein